MTLYLDDDFVRADECDDHLFYGQERLVQHLDDEALKTVEKLIGSVIDEQRPIILDLMASFDSHLPTNISPEKTIGLGMNSEELGQNKALDSSVVHDLNANPALPFDSGQFDAVINTVSVDYLTRPEEVFEEVARVLKPGGVFLVIFSNRFFKTKVTNIWKRSSEPERVLLVEKWFDSAGSFEKPNVYTSIGKSRPSNDKYSHLGIPSDPVYAVLANKKGSSRPPRRLPSQAKLPSSETIEENKTRTRENHRCPYCNEKLRKWEVPQTPYTEWPNEYFHICFNDRCAHFENGWQHMTEQGNVGWSYRLMYDDKRNVFTSIPVQTVKALREGIVD